VKAKSFRKYLTTRLDVEEIKEIEVAAELEAEALAALQADVVKAITGYMEKNKLGFNDLVRKLGKSPTQVSRIIKGEANLTLTTVAQIYALMKRTPRIVTRTTA